MDEYLKPTEFLNFDDASVRDFAESNTAGTKNQTDKAVKLYYAVRDGFNMIRTYSIFGAKACRRARC